MWAVFKRIVERVDTVWKALVLIVTILGFILLVFVFVTPTPGIACDNPFRKIIPQIPSDQFEHCKIQNVLSEMQSQPSKVWIIGHLGQPLTDVIFVSNQDFSQKGFYIDSRNSYFRDLIYDEKEVIVDITGINRNIWKISDSDLIIDFYEDKLLSYTIYDEYLFDKYDFDFVPFILKLTDEMNQYPPSLRQANAFFDQRTDAEKIQSYCDGTNLMRGYEGEGTDEWLLSEPCLSTGEADFVSNTPHFFFHLKDIYTESGYGIKCSISDLEQCGFVENVMGNENNIKIAGITVIFSGDHQLLDYAFYVASTLAKEF